MKGGGADTEIPKSSSQGELRSSRVRNLVQRYECNLALMSKVLENTDPKINEGVSKRAMWNNSMQEQIDAILE